MTFHGMVLFVAFGVGVIFFTGTVNAVANIPDIYVDYARTLGASRLQIYWTVIIPAMFPELRSSILLGLGMAWTAVVGAEFLGAQTGLGQIIVYSQYFGYVDRMFLVALILLTYAAITYALFERASRRLTEWMPVFGVWPIATKKPFAAMRLDRASFQVSDANPAYPAGVAQHLLDHRVELEPDLALGDPLHQLVDHDLLGAELVAAVDQHHAAADVGEVERFLDRGVAAADHHHVLALEEEAVAGGAGRDPAPHVLLLRGQAEVLRGGAGGDDQRVAAVAGRCRPRGRAGAAPAARYGSGRTITSVSKRSACCWKRCIRSGPWTPSASAGQLSTSVVVISWPPCATPAISTGRRFARAA